MACASRPMIKKDLKRIQAYYRGEIEKPQWIIDWNEKIKKYRQSLAVAVAYNILTPQEKERYVHAIDGMMHRNDRLYTIWLDEVPFKTWEDLADERPPSVGDLFRYTVEDTEDYLNGPGVPAFALFLDQQWKGFMKDFAHQCLRECDPLLEESLELTPDIRRHLAYPEQVFDTKNPELLESKLMEWSKNIIPPCSPDYVKRLFVANIMVALGNEFGACTQMEYARCEAVAPNFYKLMQRRDPRADIYLKQTQYWQTDVLLGLWPA